MDETPLIVLDETWDDTNMSFDPLYAGYMRRGMQDRARKYKLIADEELEAVRHQERAEMLEREQRKEEQRKEELRKKFHNKWREEIEGEDRLRGMQYAGHEYHYRESAPPSLDGPYLPGGGRNMEQLPRRHSSEQRRRKPLAMPDMYNGKTSWLDYVAHFESCALLNEWSEEDKVAFLRTRLSGVARRTLKSVLSDPGKSYRQIIAALGNRFEPEDREDLYLSQLRGRRKLQDEKLEDLADDIRRLCELAYPTYDFEALERVGRNHFLDAITDPQLRHDISLSGAKTLTKAAQVASEREAFLEGERNRTGAQKIQSVATGKSWDQEKQQMQAKIDAMAGELKKWKTKATQNGNHNSKPKTDKSSKDCYYCGKLGHFAYECYKKQADEGNQNGFQQSNGGRGRGTWRGRGRGRGRGGWRGRGRGRGRGGANINFDSSQNNSQAGSQSSQQPQAGNDANTEFQEN
mgnify:CR=1 FL=1